jgi:putative zinc finger/helix-turn-helix YgiT family protein
MHATRGRLGLSVNGEEIAVPNAPHLLCPKCHEKLLRIEDEQFLHRRTLAIYRKKYGLLSPDEIRDIRERSGMTQVQLGRLLRLGPNTLSRWESDRYVQTGAMDVLLRLVRDVPGSLAYLRRHAA